MTGTTAVLSAPRAVRGRFSGKGDDVLAREETIFGKSCGSAQSLVINRSQPPVFNISRATSCQPGCDLGVLRNAS